MKTKTKVLVQLRGHFFLFLLKFGAVGSVIWVGGSHSGSGKREGGGRRRRSLGPGGRNIDSLVTVIIIRVFI